MDYPCKGRSPDLRSSSSLPGDNAYTTPEQSRLRQQSEVIFGVAGHIMGAETKPAGRKILLPGIGKRKSDKTDTENNTMKFLTKRMLAL